MQPNRIFETVLYPEDLTAAERFYHEALGLEVRFTPAVRTHVHNR
jgi:hypothetical protein